MIREGTLRLGTLYDYRALEEHGQQRGDSEEGRRTVWSHDKSSKPLDQLNPLEQKAIRIPLGSGTVEGNYLEREEQSINAWIFCASIVFDMSIARRLSADCDEDYDACVEILKPESLCELISACLRSKARFVAFQECVYADRRQHYANAPHPAILKDPRYAYQREVRAIWQPISDTLIQPELVTAGGIQNLCRICYP
jgi:hypothetical protein